VAVAAPVSNRVATSESTVLVLALDDWAGVRPWLHEVLFDDPVHRAAFGALDEAEGVLSVALERADPAAADLLQRMVVEEPADDPPLEVFHLIRMAALRAVKSLPPEEAHVVREMRVLEQRLSDSEAGPEAAAQLLGWLETRVGERV
jgi:hypothetical protein